MLPVAVPVGGLDSRQQGERGQAVSDQESLEPKWSKHLKAVCDFVTKLKPLFVSVNEWILILISC